MAEDEQTLEVHTLESDGDRSLLPYSAAMALDRSAGGLLKGRGDQQDIPEGLLRQLQDPAVLEDTPMYWFRTIASNSTTDHYGTIMQTDSLKNYARDAEDGLPFCNSHRHDELPFGRTYAGRFFQARGQHLARTEEDVYVPYDLNVNGVDTTHFIRGVRAGVVRDVSIQFDPERIVCSIDGRNMPRSLMDLLSADPEDPKSPCRHIPGMQYTIDGKKVRALGNVFGAHQLELSPVYRGATAGAAILSPSRALVVDERSAPPAWTLLTPSLRMAALLAEADLLDRSTAQRLEDHTRGISFPSVTRQLWAPGASPQEENMPGGEHARTRANPEVSEDTAGSSRAAEADVDAASQDDQSSAEQASEQAVETEAAPPPVRRMHQDVSVLPEALEVEHSMYPDTELRVALVRAGLANEGFDGDPIAQIEIAGKRLEVERAWGGWGRRYREELCVDIEREGVRAFGAAGWSEAKPAYEGVLKRGDADELIALRKHFEQQALRDLKGGRSTVDEVDERPNGAASSKTRSNGRNRIPAAAFRS